MIVISHDERFITTVAKELWVCADGSFTKFKGDVQAYKVREDMTLCLNIADYSFSSESHCQQCQGKALDYHSTPSLMDLSPPVIIIYILLEVLRKPYYLLPRVSSYYMLYHERISTSMRERKSRSKSPDCLPTLNRSPVYFYGPECLCLGYVYRYECEQLKSMCVTEAAKI